MPRKIEFRAWFRHRHWKLDDKNEWVDKMVMGEVTTISFKTNRVRIIEQFTGLKDKNGKEIYEGDLLASHNGALAGQVIYQAPSFVIKKNKHAKRWFTFDLSEEQLQFYEIVGNIHENAELCQTKS